MAKKYTIRYADEMHSDVSYATRRTTYLAFGGDDMSVSDGYHTMDELYEHRIALFIALCSAMHAMDTVSGQMDMKTRIPVWRSKMHADGSSLDGWFILGIFKESGKQITYHLPLAKWEETDFAETLDNAPEFDGHTPADVIERLKIL